MTKQLGSLSEREKTVSKASVYVAVASDILHEGILNVISRAAELGEVTVGLMSDEAIATYKRVPLLPYESRAHVYTSLRDVARVVRQDTLSYRENLLALRPDYVVHGDDWDEGPQAVVRAEVLNLLSQWGGELVEVPYTRGVSATSLEARLREFRRSPDARRGSLRQLLRLKPYLRFIEASNGLGGLIVENTGVTDTRTGQVRSFDGMWVSSLCDSTLKGKPDIELVDFTSRLNTIQEIMEVTTKPIILDGDTGGRTEWFTHNVRTLERIGVSAVIVEDKVGLKQNSLFGTERVQQQDDPHAFAAKIAAGKRAQRTQDFMIVARIESLIADAGLEDALSRAKTYVGEGGADAVMIHSRDASGEDVTQFMAAFKAEFPEVPIVLVPTTYNHLTEDELAARGASVIIHANHLLRASYLAMRNVAESILEHGRSKEADALCLPIKDVLTLIPEE